MSRGKAFFSTVPGVISALAGLVTVLVGVLAISAQLGWLDDGDDGDGRDGSTTTTVTTAVGGTAGPGGSGGPAASTGAPGKLSATPTSIRFVPLQAKTLTVTLRNDGGPVTFTVEMTGTDKAQFRAVPVDCPTPLGSTRTCPVEITFAPTRAGEHKATLVATPSRGNALEVPVVGNHLL